MFTLPHPTVPDVILDVGSIVITMTCLTFTDSSHLSVRVFMN